MRLELVEPRSQPHPTVGPKPEQPHPSVTRWTLVYDDPGIQQYPKMLAHRRRWQTKTLSKVAGATGRLTQRLDRSTSGGIGECPKHRVEILAGGHLSIVAVYGNYCQEH